MMRTVLMLCCMVLCVIVPFSFADSSTEPAGGSDLDGTADRNDENDKIHGNDVNNRLNDRPQQYDADADYGTFYDVNNIEAEAANRGLFTSYPDYEDRYGHDTPGSGRTLPWFSRFVIKGPLTLIFEFFYGIVRSISLTISSTLEDLRSLVPQTFLTRILSVFYYPILFSQLLFRIPFAVLRYIRGYLTNIFMRR